MSPRSLRSESVWKECVKHPTAGELQLEIAKPSLELDYSFPSNAVEIKGALETQNT